MTNSWGTAQRLLIARLYSGAPNKVDNGIASWCKGARLDTVDAANVSNNVADESSVRIDASRLDDRLNAGQAGVLFIDQSRRALVDVVRDANWFPQ